MGEIALQKACELAASFEGCVLHPYLDVGGVPTIGYGATHLLDGTKVTMATPPITATEALGLLKKEMAQYLGDVEDAVRVPVNPNQLAALADFAYNEGSDALAGSTLLHLLNEGDPDGAADQFSRWVYGGGQLLKGLVRRRAAEKQLFTTPYEPPAS